MKKLSVLLFSLLSCMTISAESFELPFENPFDTMTQEEREAEIARILKKHPNFEKNMSAYLAASSEKERDAQVPSWFQNKWIFKNKMKQLEDDKQVAYFLFELKDKNGAPLIEVVTNGTGNVSRLLKQTGAERIDQLIKDGKMKKRSYAPQTPIIIEPVQKQESKESAARSIRRFFEKPEAELLKKYLEYRRINKPYGPKLPFSKRPTGRLSTAILVA